MVRKKQLPEPDAPHREIAERLIAVRLANELEQSELCQSLNIQPNTYSQWESGKKRPNLDDAMRLCERFGVTLDWIYRGDPSGLPLRHADAILRYHTSVSSASPGGGFVADPERRAAS